MSCFHKGINLTWYIENIFSYNLYIQMHEHLWKKLLPRPPNITFKLVSGVWSKSHYFNKIPCNSPKNLTLQIENFWLIRSYWLNLCFMGGATTQYNYKNARLGINDTQHFVLSCWMSFCRLFRPYVENASVLLR